MDCSPPSSSVHGILQARTPEWVVIAFSGDLPDPGIFQTQGSNLDLRQFLELQVDYLPLSHQGSPVNHMTVCNTMDCTVHGILQTRILEWVASPFFRGSSQPRDRIQVSYIAGRFFTSWATREAQLIRYTRLNNKEKETATHSNVLAWRIPGTEGPGGLPSMELHRVRHDWSDLAAAAAD